MATLTILGIDVNLITIVDYKGDILLTNGMVSMSIIERVSKGLNWGLESDDADAMHLQVNGVEDLSSLLYWEGNERVKLYSYSTWAKVTIELTR